MADTGVIQTGEQGPDGLENDTIVRLIIGTPPAFFTVSRILLETNSPYLLSVLKEMEDTTGSICIEKPKWNVKDFKVYLVWIYRRTLDLKDSNADIPSYDALEKLYKFGLHLNDSTFMHAVWNKIQVKTWLYGQDMPSGLLAMCLLVDKVYGYTSGQAMFGKLVMANWHWLDALQRAEWNLEIQFAMAVAESSAEHLAVTKRFEETVLQEVEKIKSVIEKLEEVIEYRLAAPPEEWNADLL